MRAFLPICLALLAMAGASPLKADDDHGRARTWVQEGRILPLGRLLDQLPPEFSGRVLEAELETRKGVPVYELELLRDDGRVLEVEVDARDGTVLQPAPARRPDTERD